jgi:hypothetical protein
VPLPLVPLPLVPAVPVSLPLVLAPVVWLPPLVPVPCVSRLLPLPCAALLPVPEPELPPAFCPGLPEPLPLPLSLARFDEHAMPNAATAISKGYVNLFIELSRSIEQKDVATTAPRCRRSLKNLLSTPATIRKKKNGQPFGWPQLDSRSA